MLPPAARLIDIPEGCEDVSGREFGFLTAIGFVGKRKNRASIWLFKCECGKLVERVLSDARRGKSCGCKNPTRIKSTHGMSKSREHLIWRGMHGRCSCKTSGAYQYYGERGVVVCERWTGEDGFVNFLSDMGRCPSQRHSIDRIDVNGNYEPGNCRWATNSEQAANKRDTVLLTANGETLCLTEWARRLGCRQSTIYGRIERGWGVEDAVTRPPKQFKTTPGRKVNREPS